MHIMYFNLIYPYIALFYSPPLPLPILFHLSSSVLFCKHDVIYFPLTSTNERKYTILSLWNRLISLNVMISSPILFLVKKKTEFNSSLWLSKFALCIYHILFCAFIPWWSPKMVPECSYCEYCSDTHEYTGVSMVGWLPLSICTHKLYGWIIWEFCLSLSHTYRG
jgi:hypothetical protein